MTSSTNELQELLPAKRDELIEQLNRYQQKRINELIATGATELRVAEQWMNFDMLSATSGFGASSWKTFGSFWGQLRQEIYKLFCTEKEYVEEREAITAAVKGGHATLIAAIATTISPYMDVATPVLAPPIALLLIVIGRAGVGTVCERLASLQGPTGNEPPTASQP